MLMSQVRDTYMIRGILLEIIKGTVDCTGVHKRHVQAGQYILVFMY